MVPGNSGKEIAMDTGRTAWLPRSPTDTAKAAGRGGRAHALNALNHNLTGAAVTQFTHLPTCNCVSSVCVCECGKAKELAAISGQTPKS